MRSYILGRELFGDAPGSRCCSIIGVADLPALCAAVAGPRPWTGKWVALDTLALPVELLQRSRMR